MNPIQGTVNWGIIGCGDVCEVKSGPAFNQVEHSKLVAVMRRDAAKAEDYARRHSVARHYQDARQLIADQEVNAVYIATPPAFPKAWEVGLRFRFLGGAPYTPFDTLASKYNYSLTGSGTLQYAQLNTLRLASLHALDVRVTKQWNFSHWALAAYLDIQNAYNRKNPSPPSFTLLRNPDNSLATVDGKPYDASRPENTIAYPISNTGGTILPSIGLIVEL